MNTPFHIFTPIVLLLAFSAGAAAQGRVTAGRYHSERGWFSVPVPKASNWAGVPFAVQGTSVNRAGVGDFDAVVFSVKDFGEVLIASVRHIPERVLAEMRDKGDKRTVLSDLAYKALHDWRDDIPESLPVEPKVVEDTFVSTPHGEAILRVYMAERGSLLTRATGRRPTAADTFDTLIAVIAARQGDRFLSAIAENDAEGGDKETLKERVRSFFSGIVVPGLVAAQKGDWRAAIESKDYPRARTMLTPLAQGGDSEAQHALGVLYYNGWGVPLDFEEASKWFRKGARNRCLGLMEELGGHRALAMALPGANPGNLNGIQTSGRFQGLFKIHLR